MEKILIRGRCRTQISHRRACDYFIYGFCLYTKCPYILVLIYKVMLQHLVRRCLAPCLHRTARTALMTLRLGAPITSARAILNEKKKQAYQNQMQKKKQQHGGVPEQISIAHKQKFESILVDLGKDLHQYLNFKLGASRIDVSPILTRFQSRLQKQLKKMTSLQLLNYLQIVKSMCLGKMESIEDIKSVYRILQNFMETAETKAIVQQHCRQLWNQSTSFPIQIRSLSLMQFMQEEDRLTFLKNIIPLSKYFKTCELSILLFEKYYYDYPYSYQLLDQIFQNQYFTQMEDINLSYLKMLFVEKIKGKFVANQDGIYGKILTSTSDRPNILAHSSFDKLVKMLQSQGYFVQSQSARQNLEMSLNMFISIAKNQNYGQNSINLHQLVGLYLGFQQTNSTGQSLLSQITFTSKTSNFAMRAQDLQLYKKLLMNVLKNGEAKLKYERLDYLNKEYTIDTINFLEEFLPKYIALWPEVIFQVNHVGFELFPAEQKQSNLMLKFQEVYQKILKENQAKLGLKNIDFTMKILKFVKTYQKRKYFAIQVPTLEAILYEAMDYSKSNQLSNQHLEMINLTLSLLQSKCREGTLKSKISKFNRSYIESQMNQELQKSDKSYIKSYDHRIIWLSLINAKAKSYGCAIDESIVEVFANERLLFMINSLSYSEVYELLIYVTELSRLKMEIYERLLSNLSTFIIYISDQSLRKSPFFLNHKYKDDYIPICKLILDNKSIFAKISDKESLKVVQIMFVKNIEVFTSKNILDFLEVLGDSSFLSISLSRELEDLQFKESELDSYEGRALKGFQYYNKSLLKYFEGIYNQSDIKKKLKGGNLLPRQIQECFSRKEVYKTIIMNSEVEINFQLPEPRTNIPDYKYMYACQQIYQRIKASNDFSFNMQSLLLIPRVKPVNLDKEKDYINMELMVSQGSENDFRIDQRNLPNYIKMEVWKSYSFFDKKLMIEPKDLFLNSKKLTDQILNKIVKGVYGKYQKIREVVKEFSCNQELITMLNDANIRYEQHGAALEFTKEGEDEATFTLLCTSNTNYKILYICAYFMEKHGLKVTVLKENQDVGRVFTFIKDTFPKKQEEELQPEKEDESEDTES